MKINFYKSLLLLALLFSGEQIVAQCTSTLTCPSNIMANSSDDDASDNGNQSNPGDCHVSLDIPEVGIMNMGACSDQMVSWSVWNPGSNPAVDPADDTGMGNGFQRDFIVGVSTVRYTVTDAPNTATCDFTVTVVDDENPMINGSDCGNISGMTGDDGLGNCTTEIAIPGLTTSGLDNCPNPTITYSVWNPGNTPGVDPPDGTGNMNGFLYTFEVGVTIVRYDVTDAAGNTDQCQFNVTITDNENPSISCPSNVTVNTNDDGGTDCSVQVLNIAPTGSSDNCPGGTITWDITGDTNGSGFDDASGTIFTGVSTVTYTITDGNSNTGTCSFTVTVVDNTDPVLDCNDSSLNDINLNTNASCVNGTDIPVPDAMDNCDGSIAGVGVRDDGMTLNAPWPLGTTTVVWTWTDAANNSHTCSQDVIVSDDDAPTANCMDITVNVTGDGVTIPNNALDDGSSDNCDTDLTFSLSQNMFDCDDLDNSPIDVIMTVSDDAGNSNTCSAEVTLEVSGSPNAVCQNISVNLDANGMASIMASDVDGGSTFTCDGELSINVSNFTCSDLGDNDVVLTVNDNGMSSTCTAVVTVVDDIPPIPDCMDITVQLDGNGDATITGAMINNNSMDNCSIQSFSVTPNSFDCGDIGNVNVVLTVTDDSGNASTCTATVTVQDNLSPTPNCNNINFTLDSDGTGTLSPAQIASIGAGSTDNCDTNLDFSVNQSSFNCGDEGSNTVTLTVTDDQGNSATCNANINVIIPNNLDLEIMITPDPASYCPGSSVTLTGEVSNGSGPFDYNWSGSSGTPSGNMLVGVDDAGLYAVTVTDNNQCTASDNIQVTEESEVSVTIVGDPSLFLCDGEDVLLSTTDLFDEYEWTGGSQNPTLTVTTSGPYAVTVTDDSGCTGSTSVQVQDADEITINEVSNETSEPSCNGETDGQITVIASGGNCSNFSYEWNTGVMGPLLPNIGAGNYSVTVTCLDTECTEERTFNLGEPDPIGFTTITVLPESCEGDNDGRISFDISGGTGPYTYDWDGNGDPIATSGSVDITDLSDGIYTVTIEDSNMCSNSMQFTIDPGVSVDVSITGGNAICLGETITLIAEGATSYQWDDPDNSTSPSIMVSPPATRNYTVVGTIPGNNGATCSDQATQMVTVNPQPSISISNMENSGNNNNDNTICSEDVITLRADCSNCSNNISYEWNGGQEEQTIQVQLVNEGNTSQPSSGFNVTVTDDDTECASEVIDYTVNVTPLPNSNFDRVGFLQVNVTNQFTAENNDTENTIQSWDWTFLPNGNPNADCCGNDMVNVQFTLNGTQTARLITTDDLDCSDETSQSYEYVGEDDCFSSINGPSTVCSGETESFLGSGNPSDFGTEIDSWLWQVTPGSAVISSPNSQNTDITFNSPSTTYTVSLTITDNAPGDLECEATSTFMVTTSPNPDGELSLLDNPICEGNDAIIVLNNLVASSGFNLQYDFTVGGSQRILESGGNNQVEFNLGQLANATSIVLNTITDLNTGCESEIAGEMVTVNVVDSISGEILTDLTQCDPSGNIVEEFKILLSGGNGVYMYNPEEGDPEGMVDGDTLILMNLDVGASQNIQIFAGSVCFPLSLNIVPECACNRESLPNQELVDVMRNPARFCESDEITFTYDENNGVIPEAGSGDTLVFVLYTQQSFSRMLPIDSIKSVTTLNGSFTFNSNSMEYDQQYFIIPLITSISNGQANFLNDDCLTSAVGTPVTFVQNPVVSISYDGVDITDSEVSACLNEFDVQFDAQYGNIDINSIDGHEWKLGGSTAAVTDNTRDYALINMPDAGSSVEVVYILSVKLDAEGLFTCSDSASSQVNLDLGTAPDKETVYWWPGNILACGADDVCYNWGTYDVNTDTYNDNIPNNDGKFYFAGKDLERQLLDPAFNTKYWVDIYGDGTNCNYDPNGCNTRLFFNVSEIPIRQETDVDENELKVFPNPFLDQVNMRIAGGWGGNYTISLANSLGQQIYNKQIRKDNILYEENLDFSNYDNGVYILIIENEFGERKVKKLIKSGF